MDMVDRCIFEHRMNIKTQSQTSLMRDGVVVNSSISPMYNLTVNTSGNKKMVRRSITRVIAVSGSVGDSKVKSRYRVSKDNI